MMAQRSLSGDELLFIARFHYRGFSGPAIAEMIRHPAPDVEAVRAQLDPLTARLPAIAIRPLDGASEDSAMPLNMSEVVAKIATAYRVGVCEIMGGSRSPRICRARQAAFHACRAVKFSDGRHRWNWMQIARFFGRDHSTVIHGVKAHAARIAAEVLA